MSGVTFSSPYSRFSTFNIGNLIHAPRPEVLTTLTNIPGVPRPVTFTFQGGGLMAKHAAISAIVCDGVIGPRRNAANHIEIVAMTGELVTAAVTYNGATFTGCGVLLDLTATLGPGNVIQRFDVTFQPCDVFRHAWVGTKFQCGGGEPTIPM